MRRANPIAAPTPVDKAPDGDDDADDEPQISESA
jgi:hypothetical protein